MSFRLLGLGIPAGSACGVWWIRTVPIVSSHTPSALDVSALMLTLAPGVPVYRQKLRPCEFQVLHLEPGDLHPEPKTFPHAMVPPCWAVGTHQRQACDGDSQDLPSASVRWSPCEVLLLIPPFDR